MTGKRRRRYELCKPNDPALRAIAHACDVSVAPRENQDLRELVEDMIEIVQEHNALGLAAPQVGVSLKVIVVRASPDDKPIVVINPATRERGHIIEHGVEACLSIPNVTVGVFRANRVSVVGVNLDGEPIMVRATGMLARVLQHEIDHLYGVLITDYAASANAICAWPSKTDTLVCNCV